MVVKNSVMVIIFTLALSAMANQRISFTRQLQGGISASFGCECYSTQRTGTNKMIWYPSAACWVDSFHTNRTCKVWTIMPLRRIEQDMTSPIWHCSQKPRLHEREPSMRCKIQFLCDSAETCVTFDPIVENVFDIDVGDVFPWFGRSVDNPIFSLLEGRSGLHKEQVDSVLCSSGRIGIDGGRVILMYGLMASKDGECYFKFSVNGLTDVMCYNFVEKDGDLFDSSGRQIQASPIVHASSPAIAIWLSASDTVSLRISYDYKAFQDPKAINDDIHISLNNLRSILEWLSQPPEIRGPWQSVEKCSLKKRRIF